jgi:glutamate-1-semialdehyde aminotransferase
MDLIPEKRVVHAGTFNGNPISLAAARATLTVLNARGGAALRSVRQLGERLMEGIRQLATKAEIPLLINGVGSAFHLSFTERAEMRDYRETLDADTKMRDAFLEACFKRASICSQTAGGTFQQLIPRLTSSSHCGQSGRPLRKLKPDNGRKRIDPAA